MTDNSAHSSSFRCLKTVGLVPVLFGCALALSGCGTTRWSDTSRTGTEQLLISNAVDQAIGKIDFTPLNSRKVFVESGAITDSTDSKYISTTIRQHLAACGGILCDDKEDADYVLEVRTGAVGTDRNDVLVGIPAITIPALPGSTYSASQFPEIPFVKRTDQRAVVKVAVFAYNKTTGRPLWYSGNNQSESWAKALWVAGAGPITKGNIYDGPNFSGSKVPEMPLLNLYGDTGTDIRPPADRAAFFKETSNKPVKEAAFDAPPAPPYPPYPLLPPTTATANSER
jgi:hypothetical protein